LRLRAVAIVFAGSALAWVAVASTLREARFHLARAAPVTVALGVLLWLGLLLGARAARARQRREPRDAGGRIWPAVVTFAGVCMLTAWAASRLEAFRGMLTRHFLLPPGVLGGIVLAPPAAGVLLAAFAGAMAFVQWRSRKRSQPGDTRAGTLLAEAILSAMGAGGLTALAAAAASSGTAGAGAIPFDAQAPFPEAARRVVWTDAFRITRVNLSAGRKAAWRLLWTADDGPAVDLLLFESSPFAAPGWPAVGDEALVERVVRRLVARLVPGGRVVIEQPAEPGLRGAAQRALCAAMGSSPPAYRLVVASGRERYEAIAYGRDIPALVRRTATYTPFQVTLEPVKSVSGRPSSRRERGTGRLRGSER